MTGERREVCRRGVQFKSVFDHIADHALKFLYEFVETGGECGDFIFTLDLQAPGQVAFPLGNVGQSIDNFEDRPGQ